MKSLATFLLVCFSVLGYSQTIEYNTKWCMNFQYPNVNSYSNPLGEVYDFNTTSGDYNIFFSNAELGLVSLKYVFDTTKKIFTLYQFIQDAKTDTFSYYIEETLTNGYICEAYNVLGVREAKIHIWFCDNIYDYNIYSFIVGYNNDGSFIEFPSVNDKVILMEAIYYNNPSTAYTFYSVIQ